MSIQDAYRRSYEQIARDHVKHWRATGLNPFQGAEHVKANEDATVSLIEKYTEPGNWLDVGCGMGDLLQRLPEYREYGIDISTDYLQVAADRNLRVQNASVEKIPFYAGHFDLVTATDILEHVLDLNRAVRELVRVLKPSGTLIVRVPNEEDLSGFVNGYTDYEYVHLRCFDRPSLWLLLEKIFGLEVLEVTVIGDCLHGVARK